MLHNPVWPTADLQAQNLEITVIEAKSWYRIHHKKREAIAWNNKSVNRFNAPAGEFGTLYAASSFNGAFIETLGRMPSQHVVAEADIRVRQVCTLKGEALSLLNISGPLLAQLGLDANFTTYPDYNWTRAWALALWQHPITADGLLYLSRFDPSQSCIVLFDRAKTKIQVSSSEPVEEHPEYGPCLDLYNFTVI